jgi:hypothetical protein
MDRYAARFNVAQNAWAASLGEKLGTRWQGFVQGIFDNMLFNQ